MAAAARARRVSPEASITVLEKSSHVSLGVCGLPYLIAGLVPSVESLIAVPEKELREKRNLNILTRHEAVALDLSARKVVALGPRGHHREFGYDRLLLAPGGKARRPAVPGCRADNVFTLQGLDDALILLAWLDRPSCRRALVVGGGYLGLEMAECLCQRGLEVSLWEKEGRFLAFEESLSQRLVQHLQDRGVTVQLSSELQGLEGGRTGPVSCAVSHGQRSKADLFLLATGVDPQISFLKQGAFDRGPSGALRVDRRGETSQSGIFAAGDCVEIEHRVSGRPIYLPLALPASRLGRVVGENCVGGQARFAGTLGTLATRVFELEVARTGLDRASADAAGFEVEVVEVRAGTRAGYYPGGQELLLTVLYDRRTRRLLGAQAVGREGAVARVGIVSAALEGGLTVDDLERLDLAYAPPLATLWDPLVLAGRISAGSPHGERN